MGCCFKCYSLCCHCPPQPGANDGDDERDAESHTSLETVQPAQPVGCRPAEENFPPPPPTTSQIRLNEAVEEPGITKLSD